MVRTGVPERITMAVSGHRSRSAFDRYDIVSHDHLAAAAAQTLAYREAKREAPPPLAAARDARAGVRSEQRGQSADHPADSGVALEVAGNVRS